MKLLLTRSIQAALDAEIDAGSRASRVKRRERCACDCGLRPLATRLGAIDLLCPRWHRTELFAHFSEIEGALLVVLARMAVAGEATPRMSLEFAQLVCGRNFDGTEMEQIITSLNFELAGFFRRQLEMEYPCLGAPHRLAPTLSGCAES